MRFTIHTHQGPVRVEGEAGWLLGPGSDRLGRRLRRANFPAIRDRFGLKNDANKSKSDYEVVFEESCPIYEAGVLVRFVVFGYVDCGMLD